MNACVAVQISRGNSSQKSDALGNINAAPGKLIRCQRDCPDESLGSGLAGKPC
jgi:hypothetical protein